jgi:pimeloyl-ACP methyl ester carboxylesterase
MFSRRTSQSPGSGKRGWRVTGIGALGLMALSVFASYAMMLAQAQAQEKANVASTGLGGEFKSRTAAVNGITLHYVRVGSGPAVILIHGFPQDWTEYRAIMPRLSEHFTVIAVDLRGVGGSSAPTGGYDVANMAEDVYQLAVMLNLGRPYVVGHDIGGMVAYAYARSHPAVTRGAMILDVPLPGIGGWDEIQGDPSVWHFRFMQVPGLAEKLVNGRQADYFNYFFGFGKFSPSEIDHFVSSYATPARIHAAFEMYRAFPDDVKSNLGQRGASEVPLFLGFGEKSPFAKLIPKMTDDLRANGFAHVATGQIQGSVHYLVQDQPGAVAELIEKYASAS